MKLTLSVVLFALLIISCSDKKQLNPVNQGKKIKVNANRAEAIKRSKLFSLAKIIKLENSKADTVGEVGNILLEDDFMIIDADDISLYDYDGNFLKNIGNRGKGPGEYTSKRLGYDKDENSLLVLDRTQHKIMKYGIKHGDLKSEKKIKIWGQAIFNKNELNLVYAGNERTQYNKKLFIYDEDGNLLKNAFEIKDYEKQYIHFIDKTNFYPYKDSVRFLYSFDNTIYNISLEKGNLAITRRYTIDFGASAIPKSFFNKDFQNIRQFMMALHKSDYSYGNTGYYENNNMVMFMFWKGDKPLLAIYSKETEHTTIINNIIDDMLFKGQTIGPEDEFFSYYFHKNKLYFLMHAYQFVDRIEKMKEENPNVQLDTRLANVYNTINANDNPIIFEFKINGI